MPKELLLRYKREGIRLIKKVKIEELYKNIPEHIKPLFEDKTYPWEILPDIKSFVSALVESGIDGYTKLSEGVLVGRDVKMAPNVIIEAPAIIGHGSELRTGAFIRGSVIICDRCVVGNSTELKNCILMNEAQVPHYNYVGDSILGHRAHMGAGTVCSNLKSDHRNVVIHGEIEYESGLRKVGAFLGDFADVGCNSVLNPGTIVGMNTAVYPLSSLRGVYPEYCIVKAPNNVVKKK